MLGLVARDWWVTTGAAPGLHADERRESAIRGIAALAFGILAFI